jgi:mono/diheme cytochrome c family protein
MLQCQGCHKANGSGIQGAIPDLREFGINILASERGRKFYVAVPGVSLSPLNNRQLADVLNYIIVDILNPSEKHPQTELFDIAEITKYRNIKMKYVAQERAKVVAGLDKNH